MAGYNLSETIIAGNTGHVANTNSVHDIVNKFDKDAIPASGDVLAWNGTVYVPGATGRFNVKTFGAVGDGVADDSAAFTAAINAAVASRNALSVGKTYARVVIDIPPGDYKVVAAKAMMDQTRGAGSSTYGLKFQGAGRYMSRIMWQPASSASFLCFQDDYWHGVTFEGLSFVCGTAGAGFMDSVANAFSADWRFDDCSWDGPWGIGVKLSGTNVNSEWSWIRCVINGAYATAFLYSEISASDQHLNYSFIECDVTLDSTVGTNNSFINMSKGGAIRIHGGNYIMGDVGLFFNFPEETHGSGVQSFTCHGVRFEIRTDNGKVIDCHWGEGIIGFYSCDLSNNFVGLGFTNTTVLADFYSDGAYEMPTITFQTCKWQGRHRYNWVNTSGTRQHNIVYRDFSFRDWVEAKDFCIFNPVGGATKTGSAPIVRFENCRGNGADQTYRIDCILNGQTAYIGEVSPHYVSIKTDTGTLPHNTWTPNPQVVLPLGSVITDVRWHKAAGTGSSNITNWAYQLATTEGTPTVISAIAGNGSEQWAADGFRRTCHVVDFVCDSDLKRTLQLTATNITQTTTDSVCIIDYLA